MCRPCASLEARASSTPLRRPLFGEADDASKFAAVADRFVPTAFPALCTFSASVSATGSDGVSTGCVDCVGDSSCVGLATAAPTLARGGVRSWKLLCAYHTVRRTGQSISHSLTRPQLCFTVSECPQSPVAGRYVHELELVDDGLLGPAAKAWAGKVHRNVRVQHSGVAFPKAHFVQVHAVGAAHRPHTRSTLVP